MRRKLLFSYLYISTLLILYQSSSSLARTDNLAPSSPDGSVNEEIKLKQNEAEISKDANQKIQHGQSINEQLTRDGVHRLRRKREFRDVDRLRGSSNLIGRTAVTLSEQRSKKSDYPMDRKSRKLVSKENNPEMSSARETGFPKDQRIQDKRDLRGSQSIASRSSSSTEDDEVKSGLNVKKRSTYSSETTRVTKPKSRAIKENALMAQGSFSKGQSTALDDDAKTQQSESGHEQLDDEVDLDDKSAEYEETSEDDDDDDLEPPTRNAAGYKENKSEVLEAGKDSEKLNMVQSSAEDDDFSRSQSIVKRDTGVAEEEYEDVAEDMEDNCEDVNLADEANYQQAKSRSDADFLGRREGGDGRVKRQYLKRNENVREEIEAPKHNLKDSEQSQETEKEETNESSKRETARLEREVRPDSKDTVEQSDGVRKGSENPVNEDAVKEVKFGDDIKSSKQESNLDATSKDDNFNSDYEKKVEDQIQRKIESIKEEIKREVEEKQRVREIEVNNAKYDEIQSEMEEDKDEDEDNQSLDLPSDKRNVSKRSATDAIRSPQVKTKRHILRRIKRSDTTDARQLRAIEGVERLDPDVLAKSQLRHESIRKRSAPIYGAVDKDAPDTSKPFIKRNAVPRRVYLVHKEQKRSPISRNQETRNGIIIPEQAHVKIEDELPPGLSLDPSLLEDLSSPGKYRFKRNPDQFSRRRRSSAIVPEGRIAFLGYRPQDDDENDEGSEFDDDGFQDRTSNFQQDKSYVIPRVSLRDPYQDEPANFLFSDLHNPDELLVRRKRDEVLEDEEPVSLHGGGALAQRQTRTRAQRIQTAKIRDKRQSGNGVVETKSDSIASLVGSSQELSPRLATEYREAFGGLQIEPGGELSRFKRVKRDASVIS